MNQNSEDNMHLCLYGAHQPLSISLYLCEVTSVVFDPAILWTIAHWTPLPLDSPGKITWVGCHFLLQEIFPIQGSNLYLLSLLHWQAGSLPVAPSRKPIGANKSLKWKKEKIDVEKVFGFNFLPGYWKWQSLVLCDDLERWNWGRGKGYMHIHSWFALLCSRN